ncbi:MAG: aminopeptidase [Promethearchaeota archaeon]
MTSKFEENLEKYAEIILKIGLNLQPGQRLLIGTPNIYQYGAPIELAPLIRVIAKKAYQIGARFVDVMWDDEQLKLIRFQHAPRDSFEEFATWRTDCQYEFAKNSDAIVRILAYNPDLLNAYDHNLIATAMKTHLKYSKPYSDLISKNVLNWVGVTAPVEGWAEKVFPDISPEKRQEKFWDIIFEICRVKNEDPIAVWEAHIKQLAARCDYLNKKRYIALKFVAPGTDLRVGLPKGHIWGSARFKSQNGIDYVANIPTEEVFTLPHKDKTEGFVTATKPLPIEGMIEDFSLTFSKGRVVDASAKKGEEMLHKILETDEGTRRLGEVALVPHSSPISQSGLLFYNILLDENASCHIALGRGLKFWISNGVKMSDEEFSAAGGNISMDHVDFMIGSDKIDVDGILENGTSEPIMRKGEWAFDI